MNAMRVLVFAAFALALASLPFLHSRFHSLAHDHDHHARVAGSAHAH